jgi:hypothetical protein
MHESRYTATAIAERATCLRSLTVHDLSDEWLTALVHGCPSLTSLNASMTIRLTDLRPLVYLPSLHTLEVSMCTRLTPAAFRALQHCHGLTDIDLSHNDALTDDVAIEILRTCPLRRLILTGCHQLTRAVAFAAADFCATLRILDCANTKMARDAAQLTPAMMRRRFKTIEWVRLRTDVLQRNFTWSAWYRVVHGADGARSLEAEPEATRETRATRATIECF